MPLRPYSSPVGGAVAERSLALGVGLVGPGAGLLLLGADLLLGAVEEAAADPADGPAVGATGGPGDARPAVQLAAGRVCCRCSASPGGELVGLGDDDHAGLVLDLVGAGVLDVGGAGLGVEEADGDLGAPGELLVPMSNSFQSRLVDCSGDRKAPRCLGSTWPSRPRRGRKPWSGTCSLSFIDDVTTIWILSVRMVCI